MSGRRFIQTAHDEVHGLSARELQVLSLLRTYAGRDGRAWPSVARLARDAGCHPATIHRALRGLEGKGIIRSWPRHDRDGGQVSSVRSITPATAPLKAPEPPREAAEVVHNDTASRTHPPRTDATPPLAPVRHRTTTTELETTPTRLGTHRDRGGVSECDTPSGSDSTALGDGKDVLGASDPRVQDMLAAARAKLSKPVGKPSPTLCRDCRKPIPVSHVRCQPCMQARHERLQAVARERNSQR